MRITAIILASAFLAATAGCSNPADSVPAAAVGPASGTTSHDAAPSSHNAAPTSDVVPASEPEAAEATPSKTASSPEAPAEAPERVLVFGPEGSKIDFIGSKVTGSHEGGFYEFTGEFRTAGDRLADAGIHVVIDTKSLWSDNERLTGHLKNEDFFHVEKYPTAEFTSTKVEPTEDGWTITGDLTLHGVTKSITVPAQVQVEEDAIHLASEFSINRYDFDITYTGKSDDLIRKEVVIKLDVNAKPETGGAEKTGAG
ncbi:MAG: YceI family protein [Planctomycetes bacterium]|nr:YceI family protein [Planctomycetota bacterium]